MQALLQCMHDGDQNGSIDVNMTFNKVYFRLDVLCIAPITKSPAMGQKCYTMLHVWYIKHDIDMPMWENANREFT